MSENNVDLICFDEIMHIHTKGLQNALLSQSYLYIFFCYVAEGTCSL